MSTSTFERLREIIAKDYALAPEALSPDTVLKDLAIDSLGLIELIFTLEDRFNVTAAETPQEFLTLGDVSAYIDQLIAERDDGALGGEPSA
ncbi:MAG TPA: phosphopantetheine-binding protein [Luteimonas sp.]|nr:phosphopantetheine-binding protein [Luteimonas sp.]